MRPKRSSGNRRLKFLRLKKKLVDNQPGLRADNWILRLLSPPTVRKAAPPDANAAQADFADTVMTHGLALHTRVPPGQAKLPPSKLCHLPFGARSFVEAGHGTPTVVFESGLGQGKEAWAAVFNAVATETRAFAYDRAGYGDSEDSALPRDGLQIVAELRALLAEEEIPPPYVLVGHSLGGTLMKLFARTYPTEVVGVVLVDARYDDLAHRARQIGVNAMLVNPPRALFMMSGAATRAELAAAPLTMKQARRAGKFPPVPLIVLTHQRASTHWPQALGKVWVAGQRNMKKMSSLGRIKVCDDSGHNVHQDRPDVVVRAVLNVVRAASYLHTKRGR